MGVPVKNGIRTVGILGEGKMGTDIFYYLFPFGFDIIWLCSKDADTTRLRKQFDKRVNRSLDAGIIDSVVYEHLNQTKITQLPDDLRNCDLIIEAVPENIDLKRSLFAMLDQKIQPDCIFSSNSSSINPSKLMMGENRKDKFVGLHFFYPVSLKNIVEFLSNKDTSDTTTTKVEIFLQQINRQFLRLNEDNSFILNKIFLDFQNEAFRMVQQGYCTFRQMDQLVRTHFFQFGVFDFIDSVGLDTMLAAISNYRENCPDPTTFNELISKLSDLVYAGRLGVKSKAGFLTYPLEEYSEPEPAETVEIVQSLQKIYRSSVLYYSSRANMSNEQINYALREYFDFENNPF